MSANDPAAELAALRADLRALVNDASYAKGVRVVRASKILALLDEQDDQRVREALTRLDGTEQAAVSLMTGLTAEEIADLGGLS